MDNMFPVPLIPQHSTGSGGLKLGNGSYDNISMDASRSYDARSYDNSPRCGGGGGGGSIASYEGSSTGGGGGGGGRSVQSSVSVSHPPIPPYLPQQQQQQQLNVQTQHVQSQLSLSRSGEGTCQKLGSFTGGQQVPVQGVCPQQQVNQQQAQGMASQQQQQQQGADASVLLGMEELERQQADLEKRRASEAAR